MYTEITSVYLFLNCFKQNFYQLSVKLVLLQFYNFNSDRIVLSHVFVDTHKKGICLSDFQIVFISTKI